MGRKHELLYSNSNASEIIQLLFESTSELEYNAKVIHKTAIMQVLLEK